jgi:hypothetical protein
MELETAMARIEADPIGLEIMWSRLISIVEEMWQTVCRTAYSLIIAEAQDFANEILDPQGNPLAHSPRAMPLFNLTLTRCVKALLELSPHLGRCTFWNGLFFGVFLVVDLTETINLLGIEQQHALLLKTDR